MINRLTSNSQNIRTYLSWKMDLSIIFYKSTVFGDVTFRFGKLVGLDETLLRARGYSDAEITNLSWKLGHPVVEVPVQNDSTGQDGNALHSFTSKKRISELHEFEHRFDGQTKGQYLHNQGDVEVMGELNAFEIKEGVFTESCSLAITDELLPKVRNSVQRNRQLLDQFQLNNESLFDSDNSSGLSQINDHYIDWSFHLGDGDLSKTFTDMNDF